MSYAFSGAASSPTMSKVSNTTFDGNGPCPVPGAPASPKLSRLELATGVVPPRPNRRFAVVTLLMSEKKRKAGLEAKAGCMHMRDWLYRGSLPARKWSPASRYTVKIAPPHPSIPLPFQSRVRVTHRRKTWTTLRFPVWRPESPAVASLKSRGMRVRLTWGPLR